MHRRALLLTAIIGSANIAVAAPVARGAKVPIDLRRTTLIVRDMEVALQLYRDALDLKVVYDHIIRTPRSAPNDNDAERSLRLVLLRANDDFVGMLGLIEYRKPIKAVTSAAPVPFSIGTTVLVFNTRDLAKHFAQARKVPGVTVVEEPSRTEYPAYTGNGVIPVVVSTLQDADGYVVEINELLPVPLK